MRVLRVLPVLAAAVAVMVGAAMVIGASPAGTQIRAEVAPHFSQEGLVPGDPLAGGTLLLYHGNEVVFSATLDADGAVVVSPDPGVYDVQVQLDSAQDPLCSWGATAFGVEFPASSLELEAGFTCAGN
jgi:hypothetical protein